VRQWYLFYSRSKVSSQQAVGPIAKQLVSQIKQIPWGQNIINKKQGRTRPVELKTIDRYKFSEIEYTR